MNIVVVTKIIRFSQLIDNFKKFYKFQHFDATPILKKKTFNEIDVAKASLSLR